MQTTSNILMIRPVDFKFNLQTADNNKFQTPTEGIDTQAKALQEFDDFAALLRNNEIDVTVVNDTLEPETPDSIFPNNWISFHNNGEVFMYPMASENRRLERREDIIELLSDSFEVKQVTDLSGFEEAAIFLEGTGSMVLDRDNKLAYACLSLRTDEQVLSNWCEKTGYKAITFNADDKEGFPIYHTNVMMCVGDAFAVICLESIQNPHEREMVMQHLIHTGKEIVEISIDQMNQFAGNMLQITNKKGESLLVMSEQAYLSLTKVQVFLLEKYCRLIYSPLYTIEKNGGGSARCML
ncbi:MAG: amidinotransferase, partial [Pedobacter sp.]